MNAPLSPQSDPKILVADDDEAIQLCMEDIARQEGWNLIFAKDGEDCLNRLREENPTLLVLDQRMPKLTGDQVLSHLKDEERKLPVILMSAEKDLERFKGFDSVIHVLNKPFDLDRFITLVNSILAPAAEKPIYS